MGVRWSMLRKGNIDQCGGITAMVDRKAMFRHVSKLIAQNVAADLLSGARTGGTANAPLLAPASGDTKRPPAVLKKQQSVRGRWAIMKKKSRVYEEEEDAISIKLAIGSIVDKVSTSVAAVFSGGILSPVLASKLSDFVINAGDCDRTTCSMTMNGSLSRLRNGRR